MKADWMVLLVVVGCGGEPAEPPALEQPAAAEPAKAKAKAKAEGEAAAPDVDREVWAGAQGFLRMAVRAPSGALIGGLEIVDDDPATGALTAAQNRGLDAGDERWSWVSAAWPAGGFTLTVNQNVDLSGASQSVMLGHTQFPAQASQVTAPSLGTEDRFYELSLQGTNGTTVIGWMHADMTSTGGLDELTWYRDAGQTGPFIVVGTFDTLHASPAVPSALPSTARVIAQQP